METIRQSLCEADNFEFSVYIIVFVFIGFAIAVFVGVLRDFFRTYADGQIDALNGITKYYLKENSQGERYWLERDKETVFPEDHLISK